MLPGKYHYQWSGDNEQGSTVSAGMYFYQIQAGSFNKNKKNDFIEINVCLPNKDFVKSPVKIFN